MAAGEAIVHQHHAAGSRAVALVEVAARPDRNLQRIEIARTHVGEARRLLFVFDAPGYAEEMEPRRSTHRNLRRRGRSRDTGHRTDLAGQLLLKGDPLLQRERGGRQIQKRDRNRAALLEACVDRRQLAQAPDEHQRREDQHQRQRNLPDHQPALKSGAMTVEGHAPRRLSHGGNRIDDRRSKRRNEAEQNRGESGNGGDEGEQPPVRCDIQAHGIGGRIEEGDQSSARQQRNRYGERCACGRDQQAFDEHLRHEPQP
jgi:hypothetical protein